jgi:MFS family permease
MSTKAPVKEWYAQPKFLFVVFTFANLLLFVDRGIVPGASNEFNAFINDNVDTDTPDVFLGLLQSAFIVGLAIGSSVFGHLVHYHGRFFLTGVGCGIWMLAVMLSGMSRIADSYTFLVFARMLSGVGEASLQVNIPPWIQATAPAAERGMWLSLFFTAIPVGTAAGYAYSSLMAGSVGWEWAYFVEGMCMFPLVIFMLIISPLYPLEKHHHHGDQLTEGEQGGSRSQSKDSASASDTWRGVGSFTEPSDQLQIDRASRHPGAGVTDDERFRNRSTSNNSASAASKRIAADGTNTSASPAYVDHGLGGGTGGGTGGGVARSPPPTPSLFEEFGIVFSRPLFLCLVAGYAAQTFALIGLSTFGSALMMGLGYFDTEASSSTTFGGIICVSGMIATPLGGIMLDRMLAEATKKEAKSGPLLVDHDNNGNVHNNYNTSAAGVSSSDIAVQNVIHSGGGPAGALAGGGGSITAEEEEEGDEVAEDRAGIAKTGKYPPEHQLHHHHHHGGTGAAPEDSDNLKKRKIDCLLQLAAYSSVAAAVLMCVVYWLHDRYSFLALVGIGVGFCFFCTPAINMGFMLVVPTGKQTTPPEANHFCLSSYLYTAIFMHMS